MALKSAPRYPDADRATVFEEALQFQDFVVDLLLKEMRIVISNYSSKYYQQRYGENPQGIEIKMDLRMADTGNISIEVAEKSRANIATWTPSGIMRDDNTWLYIQGNYEKVYVFGKRFLRLLYHDRYQDRVREVKPTLKTFLMKTTVADKYCLKSFDLVPEKQIELDWVEEGVIEIPIEENPWSG